MTADRKLITPEGTEETQPFTATSGKILVKGKLVEFRIYGGQKDLEWTQSLAKNWTTSIIETNPSEDMMALQESLPWIAKIQWGEILWKTLLTFIIGLVASMAVKKATPKKTTSENSAAKQ